jgi:tetratricopeptide (TPR) repeat protein
LQAEALVSAEMVRHVRPGENARAMALLRRAVPLARRANALRTLSRAYHNLAVSEEVAGDLRAAVADFRQAIAAGEQADWDVTFSAATLAFVLIDLGAWEEGRAAARQGAKPGESMGWWMAGDPERALVVLGERQAAARRHGFVQQLLWGGYALVDWYLQLGRIDEAEALARQNTVLLREHGYWSTAGLVLGTLAEAVVLAGATDATVVVADAAALVAREGHHLSMAQVLRARGLLLAGQGDIEGALAALAQSARIARERGALVPLARTLHVLAAVARSAGAAAAVAQAEAERAAIVRGIGPETRRLPWAQGVW